MNNKFFSLWILASLVISISSPSLAADTKVSKEVEVAERMKQSSMEMRADIQRIREERIRINEDQKRMLIQQAVERKREAAAREEQIRKNAAALVQARQHSEQKARALIAEQEKAKLEAEAKALQAERERQVVMADRLAKLEREEKLVKERAVKIEFDSACMDDPDPNCSAKNKARRAQRAK